MTLPAKYKWLANEPGPLMLLEALKLYGVDEIKGRQHNPEILSWAKETGIKGYVNDEIPWCRFICSSCC